MKKLLLGLVLTAGVAMAANLGACVGCHGADWSKAALGKSKIVKDMSQEDIATALKGYKAGTYGGPMKGVMKGQVAKYSDAELDAMAATIVGK
jgi:cytochrome c553